LYLAKQAQRYVRKLLRVGLPVSHVFHALRFRNTIVSVALKQRRFAVCPLNLSVKGTGASTPEVTFRPHALCSLDFPLSRLHMKAVNWLPAGVVYHVHHKKKDTLVSVRKVSITFIFFKNLGLFVWAVVPCEMR
jgi:hypothetical protein